MLKISQIFFWINISKVSKHILIDSNNKIFTLEREINLENFIYLFKNSFYSTVSVENTTTKIERT